MKSQGFKNSFVIKLSFCFFFFLFYLNFQSLSQVRIGNQIWMGSNLSVDKFRNGDPIFQAKNCKEWDNALKKGIPAWCAFEFNQSNLSRYGALYNFYAVFDSRGLAPENWAIPSDEDWSELAKFLGGDGIAGAKIMDEKYYQWGGKITNASKFSARPTGYLLTNCWFSDPIVKETIFWSSTRV